MSTEMKEGLSKDLIRLKLDISDVIEGMGRRSDVYEGARVIMHTEKWRNKIIVSVARYHVEEFNLSGDEHNIFEFIVNKIQSTHSTTNLCQQN